MLYHLVGDTTVSLTAYIAEDGVPRTGLTVQCAVRRKSDNFFLDFNDNTFKSSGWTTKFQTLTDLNGVDTDLAGHYAAIWNSASAVVAQGEYEFVFKSTIDSVVRVWTAHVGFFDSSAAPTAAAIADAVWDEAKTGHATSGTFGSQVHRIHAALLNRQELADGSSSNFITYEDDGTTPLKTQNVTDKTGSAVSIPAGTPARRGA